MNGLATHDRREQFVSVAVGSVKLEGNLMIPDNAQGVVVCAYGMPRKISGNFDLNPMAQFAA